MSDTHKPYTLMKTPDRKHSEQFIVENELFQIVFKILNLAAVFLKCTIFWDLAG